MWNNLYIYTRVHIFTYVFLSHSPYFTQFSNTIFNCCILNAVNQHIPNLYFYVKTKGNMYSDTCGFISIYQSENKTND